MQLQRHDLAAQHPGGLRVRARVGAEAGAGQHQVTDDEQVALALVDELGLDDPQAGAAEPGGVRRGLGGALRVAEPGAEHGAAEHRGPVRREHHVGQAGHRGEQVDGVAELEVGAAQPVPLGHGERPVDAGPGHHPRVDRVLDGEVRGWAHQVAAAGRDPAGGPGPGADRVGAGRRSWALLGGVEGAAATSGPGTSTVGSAARTNNPHPLPCRASSSLRRSERDRRRAYRCATLAAARATLRRSGRRQCPGAAAPGGAAAPRAPAPTSSAPRTTAPRSARGPARSGACPRRRCAAARRPPRRSCSRRRSPGTARRPHGSPAGRCCCGSTARRSPRPSTPGRPAPAAP